MQLELRLKANSYNLHHEAAWLLLHPRLKWPTSSAQRHPSSLPTAFPGHRRLGVTTLIPCLTQGGAGLEADSFHALASQLQMGSSSDTLAAQDDPAVLVGSGESCKEAFDVHQRGSRPRCHGLSLPHRGCGSCTEQEEKSLGPQTRAEGRSAGGLKWFSGEDQSTCEAGTFLPRACGPAPTLLTHLWSPWAAGSVGSAGTQPACAAPQGVQGLPPTSQ